MAKRELSTTLKNLKFMQRSVVVVAAPQSKKKVEMASTSQTSKKCIVIMEGDPHPGASRGRMSFQSFNPSIDLNEDVAKDSQNEASSSSVEHRNGVNSERGDGLSVTQSLDSNIATTGNEFDADLKRKQPDSERDTRTPYKLPKHASGNNEGQASSQNKKNGPYKKQQKREKLDWNVLRPPKPK